MVEDMQFTPDWVAAQLEKLIGSPRALATAADKSRALGLPGAASALADLAERMAKAGGAVGASWRAAA
jgi:UDP-N-acetylglucosamine:LPS N-acetylglucosamine transferase